MRILFVLLATGICGWFPTVIDPYDTPLTMSDIEAFAELDIPQAASDIQSFSMSGIDRNVFVRFSLPAAQTADFISQISPDLVLTQGKSPFSDRDFGFAWWQPNQAEHYEGATYFNPVRNRDYQILVDTSDPTLHIVYLRVSSI